MKSVPCYLGVVAIWALAFPASVTWGAGVANGTNKAWLVRYHKENPNKKGDKAIRLRVTAASGAQLTGTLWRFNGVTGGGAPKYSQRDFGGTVALTGKIVGNGGGGNQRKREEFLMVGSYLDADNHVHLVKVRGFYFTGKNKDEDDAGREDDQVVLRVVDSDLSSIGFSAAAAPAPGDPCDELPPDDDVLMEEEASGANPPDPPYEADVP